MVTTFEKTILENVQHGATKLVDGFIHMSYSERLKQLNLPSLVYKRARGDVMEIFKLHSTKPELRFCAGSSPPRSVLEISDGEDLWQWPRLKIRLNAFRRSTIPQKRFTIIIIITPTTIVCYLKILDPETVLVENGTTRWYGKHPQMVWEDSSQIFLLPKNQNLDEIPKEIVHAKSIDSFKNKLDETWKDLPRKFYEQERFIEA